jgi:putative glutamine amidotransferase
MAQQTRPLIGLNVDYVAAAKATRPHMRLNVGYAESVYAAGGMPVLLPVLGQESEVAAFLDRLDGFVLTGGLDLDPRKLGLPRHPSVQLMAERRDDHDRMLVRLIMRREMPVLGIGVGMHQLNVACGGSLFMHLPEELPRSMPHRDSSCDGPHRHIVNLQPGTRLDEIYGGGELRVNSNHHQAVRQAGTGFRVAAVAPDGVIEAIEWTESAWFCVGLQWHPEADAASALDLQLFEALVQASIRESQPMAMAA